MSGFDGSVLLDNALWLKPEILLTLWSLALLILAAVVPEQGRFFSALFVLLGFALAALAVVVYSPAFPFLGPKIGSAGTTGAFEDGAGHPAFLADGFSLVLKLIFLLGAILCVLLAMRFVDLERSRAGEFYALLCFAVVGMMFLASGNDFATIYVGLETLSLASYVLVGFTRGRAKSNEAALKYFLLGAFASGLLLYGISLVYGATGSYNLAGIAAAIAQGLPAPRGLLEVGLILVLVGIAFKVAAVPFHMWTPDAYEGAPTPVTAFISTAAKAGAFAMLLRVLLLGFPAFAAQWTPLLCVLSVASMTLGNVAALRQQNVKRMLAYSSIAHAGYMLMGLVALGSARGDLVTERYGLTAVVLYLGVYTFTNMGAFGLLVLLRRNDIEGDTLEDFRGLARSNPIASAAMVVFLLSLAGIPTTAGFIGKWWLFGAAVKADHAWLAVVAVLNSAISLYYYARVVVAMYMVPCEERERIPVPAPLTAALVITLSATLLIGLYPEPFIRFAQSAMFPLAR